MKTNTRKALLFFLAIISLFLIPTSSVFGDEAINGSKYYIISKNKYYDLAAQSAQSVNLNYTNSMARGVYSSWILEKDGDYFRIKNEKEGTYLQANAASCSSLYTCSLKPSSSSGYQRWKLTRNTTDGYFSITMKNNSRSYLTFSVNKGGIPNLVVGNNGENSKWKLERIGGGGTIGYISCTNDADRTAINQQYNNYEKPILNKGPFSIVYKNTLSSSNAVFNEMAKHKIVIFDGHGNFSPDAGAGGQRYGDHSTLDPNGNLRIIFGNTISNLSTNKFKDTRLVYYRGCGAAYYNGTGKLKSLLTETINKGASVSMGYNDYVYIDQESYWIQKFYSLAINQNYPIWTSLALADVQWYQKYGYTTQGYANIPSHRRIEGDVYVRLN